MPTIDVSTHAEFFHNTETVVLHQRGYDTGVEVDTATTVANALRRALTPNDIRALELDATQAGCVFNLPSVDLDGEEPQPLDYIADGTGVNWTIKQASFNTFVSRWRCVCVRQVT